MRKINPRIIVFAASLALASAFVAGYSYTNNGTNWISPVSAAARPADSESNVIRFVKNPEMAPAFQAHDILGKAVSNADWPGKVVLINFWATWCPPCRAEIPELIELKKQYGDRLEIIGLSEDEDPPAKVLKFAQEKGMTYPIVMATQKLIDAFGGVPALPTSYLLDTQGRVVQKHTGLYPVESYHLEIRSLLGLPTDARVETFVDTGQVLLKNAKNATELPNVPFAGLTAEQKKHALRRMNAENCTCGCDLTISQCRVNDSECSTSMDLAAKIVRETVHGARSSPAGVSKTPNSGAH